MKTQTLLGATLALCLGATAAQAGDGGYVSVSAGLALQGDSDNSGQTGAFTTGNLGDGTTLDVAAGTPYGWNTEFDEGVALAVEIGKRKPSGLRLALEGVYTTADVDTHTDVTLGGGAIGALDAASIAGAPDPLGVSVAEVVADGRGDIQNLGVFANAYYDFNTRSAFRPYLGAGIGLVDVSVEYSPSDIAVVDESSVKVGFQGKAGASYMLGRRTELFGEAAYRVTDDVDATNTLFPGDLEIENEQVLLSVGVRVSLGR